MQVNFSFDSEKEDVGELKKLHSWLGELIVKRDGQPVSPQPVQAPAQPQQSAPQQSTPVSSRLNPNDGGASGGWPSRYSEPNLGKPVEKPVKEAPKTEEKKEEKKKPTRTAGGCRVVEYSPEFENIVSNLFGRR